MILYTIRFGLTLMFMFFVLTAGLTAATVYGKQQADGSTVKQAQTLPDNSQSINKRIAELQKQIDELRQQIETIQSGPVGKPVVTQRNSDTITIGGAGQIEISIRCNPDEVPTGGGYEVGPPSGSGAGSPGNVHVTKSEATSIDNQRAWLLHLVNSDDSEHFVKGFAECLKIVPE